MKKVIKSSIVTRDLNKLIEPTGNLYKSIAVIGKRSRQLAARQKEELTQKLAEFASTVDNLEEVMENREQIEISRFYERLPKPTLIAAQEYLEDKIYYRNPAKELNEKKSEE